jgi:hypothetical protein
MTEYLTFYHAMPASDVTDTQAGVDPGPNDFAQYGRGFYTFTDRAAAERWARIRPRLLGEEQEHVILEFRVEQIVWEGLRRHVVPDDMWVWQMPEAWLIDYDVLEGRWGVTADTGEMEGIWQVKFSPRIYAVLDAALVRATEGQQK